MSATPAPSATAQTQADLRLSTPQVLLFVYGTLLRGEANHPLLEGCRFLREVATGPGFELVDLGEFPGMVKGGRGSVQGELFSVPRDRFVALDALEDHPRTYWRTSVELADRSKAVTYLLIDEELCSRPRIASGDWRRHLAARIEGRSSAAPEELR
jgi:gamma-glutamylaminecyclotransferase